MKVLGDKNRAKNVISDRGGSVTSKKHGKRPAPDPMSRNSNNSVLEEVDVDNLLGQRHQGSTFGAQDFAVDSNEDEMMIPDWDSCYTSDDDSPCIPSTLENVISDLGGGVTTKKPEERPTPDPMSRISNNSVLEEVDVDNLLGQRHQGSTFGAQDFAVNSNEDGKMIPGSDSIDTKNDDSPCIPSILEVVISDREGGVTTKKPGERPTPDPMSRNSNNGVLEEVDVDNLLGQRHQGSTFGAQDFAVNSNEDGKMIPGSDSSDSMDDDSLSIISILEVDISDREDDVTTKKPGERPTPDPMSRNSNNGVLEEVDVDNLLGQRHQGSTFGAQDFAVNSNEDGKMIPGSDNSDSMDDDSLSIISILEVDISDREDDVTTKKPAERPTPDPMSRISNNSVLEEVDVDNLLGQRHQGSTFGAQDFAVNSNEGGKMIPGSDSIDTKNDDSPCIPSILEVVISDREGGVTTKKPGERPTPDPMSRNSNNGVLEEVDVDNLLGQRHQGSTFGAQDFAVNSNEDGKMIPGSDSSDSMDDDSLSIISILEVDISDREDDVTTKKPGERPTPDPMSRNSNNSVLEEVDVDKLLGQRHQGSTFGAQDFAVDSNEDEMMIPDWDSCYTSDDDSPCIPSTLENVISDLGGGVTTKKPGERPTPDPMSRNSNNSVLEEVDVDKLLGQRHQGSTFGAQDFAVDSNEDEMMIPDWDSCYTSDDDSPCIPSTLENVISDLGGGVTTKKPGERPTPDPMSRNSNNSVLEEVDVDNLLGQRHQGSTFGAQDFAVNSNEDGKMIPGSDSIDTKNDDSPCIPSILEVVISDREGGVTTKKPGERPTPDPMSRNSNNGVLEEVDVDNLLGQRHQGSTFGAQDFAVDSNEDEMMIPDWDSCYTSDDDSPCIPSTLENVISDLGGGVTTKKPGERPTPDPMSRNSNNSVLEEVDVDNLIGQRHQGSTFGAQDFAVNSNEDGKMIPGKDISDTMVDDSLSIISILEVVISDREGDVTTKKPGERPTPDPMSRNFNNSVLEEVDVDNLLGQRHQGSTFGAQDFAVNSNEDGKMIPGSDSIDTKNDDSPCIPSILEVVISDREGGVTTKKPGERPTPDPMSRNSNNSVLEEVDVDNLLGQRHQGSTFGAQDFAVDSNEDEMMIPDWDSCYTSDDDSPCIPSTLENVISDLGGGVTTKKPGERPTPDPMSRNSNNSVLEEVDVDNLIGQRHQGSTFGAQDFAVNSNEDGKMIPGKDISDTMVDDSLSIISILEVVISDREGDVTTKKPGERPTPDPMSRNFNNSVLEEVDVDNLLGQRHQGSTFGAQDFAVNSNEDGKMIPGSDSIDTKNDDSPCIPSILEVVISDREGGVTTKKPGERPTPDPMSRNSNNSVLEEVDVDNLLGQRHQGSTFGAQDFAVDSNEDEMMIPDWDSCYTSDDDSPCIPSTLENVISDLGGGVTTKKAEERPTPDPMSRISNNSVLEEVDVDNLLGQRHQGSTFGAQDFAVNSNEDGKMIPGKDISDTSEDYISFEDEIMSPGSDSSDTSDDDSPCIPSTLENVISDREGGVTTKKPGERPTPDPMSRNSNNSVLEEVDVDNLLGQRHQGSTFGDQDFAVNSNEDGKMIPGKDISNTMVDDSLSIISILEVVISDREGDGTTKKPGERPTPDPMSRNFKNSVLEEVDVDNLLGQRHQGSTFGAQDFAVNSNEDGKMIPGSDSSDSMDDDSLSIISILEVDISDREGDLTTKKPGERPTPDPMSRNSNNSMLEEVDVDNLLGQRHQGSTFGDQDFAVNSNEDGKMIPGKDISNTMVDDSLSIISILEVDISDREDDVTTKKPGERPTPDPMSRNSNNGVLEEVDVDNLLGQRHQGSTFGAQDFAVNSNEDGKMIPGSDSSDSMDDDSLSIISILEVVISDREGDGTTKKPGERPTPDPMSRNSNNSVLEEVDVDNLIGQRHQGSTFGAQDFAVNSNEDGKMIPGKDISNTMVDDSLSIISILEVDISDRGGDGTTKKPGERPTPDPMSRNFNNSVLEEVDVDNLLGQRHQGSTFGAQDFAVDSNEDEMMIPDWDSCYTSDDDSPCIPSTLENVISDLGGGVTTKKPGERPTPDPMSRNSNNSVLEEVDVDKLLGQRHQGSTFGAQDFAVDSNEDEMMIPDWDSCYTSDDDSPCIPSTLENVISDLGGGVTTKKPGERPTPDPMSRNSNNSVLEEVDVDNLLGQRHQGSTFGAQDFAVNSNEDGLMILGFKSIDTSKKEIMIPRKISSLKRKHTEDVGPSERKVMKELDMVEEMERKKMEKNKENIEEWWKVSKKLPEKNKKDKIKQNLQNQKMATAKMQEKRPETELEKKIGKRLTIAKEKLKALKKAKEKMVKQALKKLKNIKLKLAHQMLELEKLEREKKFLSIKENMAMPNEKRRRSAPRRWGRK
ncbi:uncharacterized protein LOC117146612 isoform X3 [Drosophila mauritiana]|uniref:Uncharacterized protein LOC117146612 isoform X2 n=1 Tax=Drosophila mauritiana TaxID=7226 RepID=A0A6P8L0B6_DROMA|nr:uncharacterized protein LOC117146612 isoform X2 [Drosophila mauritiana]XP_033168831.1 uncharacterized protein LOC117146612 isoform X3 [Drosophila mauritiana]